MWFENQVFAQIVKTNKRHQSFSRASGELECIVNVIAMDSPWPSGWIMRQVVRREDGDPGQEPLDFRLPGHFRQPLSALLNMPVARTFVYEWVLVRESRGPNRVLKFMTVCIYGLIPLANSLSPSPCWHINKVKPAHRVLTYIYSVSNEISRY